MLLLGRREALDRIEHGRSSADLARHRLRKARRHEPFEEHRGRVRAPDDIDDVHELLRRRLGFGGQAGDGDLRQAVTLREVTERCVARDDLAARTGLQTGAILAIQPAQIRSEPGGRTVECDADPLTHTRGRIISVGRIRAIAVGGLQILRPPGISDAC